MSRTTFSGPVKSEAGFELGTAGLATNYVSVPNAATYTLLAADTGKTHIMPNLSADCTITMPVEQEGLEYEFIYGGVAADAQDWIFDTGSNTNYYIGGLVHIDTDANSAGDEAVPVQPNGSSNSKMTINVPDVATRVKVLCTGTLWVVSGVVVAATAPAFADQS